MWLWTVRFLSLNSYFLCKSKSMHRTLVLDRQAKKRRKPSRWIVLRYLLTRRTQGLSACSNNGASSRSLAGLFTGREPTDTRREDPLGLLGTPPNSFTKRRDNHFQQNSERASQGKRQVLTALASAWSAAGDRSRRRGRSPAQSPTLVVAAVAVGVVAAAWLLLAGSAAVAMLHWGVGRLPGSLSPSPPPLTPFPPGAGSTRRATTPPPGGGKRRDEAASWVAAPGG